MTDQFLGRIMFLITSAAQASKMAEALEPCLPSGYDEEFVSDVEEDFQCLICHLPLKDPVQTRCGHRFCKECLEEHFRRQEIQRLPLTCPADRDGLVRDRDVFPDKATERKILSFDIKCPSEGCEWTGELREKEVHLSSCDYKVVACPHTNCPVRTPRKDLSYHMLISCNWRIVNCDHCGEPQPKCHMPDHIDQCSQFPVTCPNNCSCLIPRGKVSIHLGEDCPFSIIPCPQANMGCEMMVRRGKVDSHLQDFMKVHLDLACMKLRKTEDTLNDTQKTTKDLVEKVQKLQKRLEAKTFSSVMAKNESRYPLKFVWKISDFSDKMRKAKAGAQTAFDSDPFYTENYGYRLKLRIYPNGSESAKKSHLSVYIVIMKGEYDAILPWPLKRKMKITLIDHQEDPKQRKDYFRVLITSVHAYHFERPEEEESVGRGFTNFISHEELYSRGYVENDMLFLQFEVGSVVKRVTKFNLARSSSDSDNSD